MISISRGRANFQAAIREYHRPIEDEEVLETNVCLSTQMWLVWGVLRFQTNRIIPTQILISFSNKSLEVDLRGIHMGKEKEKGKNSRGGGGGQKVFLVFFLKEGKRKLR